MRLPSFAVLVGGLSMVGCAGDVECDGNAATGGLGPECTDLDGDGFFATVDGSPCDGDDSLVDCDPADANIYPGSVEWVGDGEDWDCDGRDAPELCFDDEHPWAGALVTPCDGVNVGLEARPTCDVCRGQTTYVVLRVTTAGDDPLAYSWLSVVADVEVGWSLEVPAFVQASPWLAVPVRWSAAAWVSDGGCATADDFLLQAATNSSCTL